MKDREAADGSFLHFKGRPFCFLVEVRYGGKQPSLWHGPEGKLNFVSVLERARLSLIRIKDKGLCGCVYASPESLKLSQ